MIVISGSYYYMEKVQVGDIEMSKNMELTRIRSLCACLD